MRTEQENKQLDNAAEKANEVAKKALTDGEIYALNVTKANILNGAFWGFTSVDDVKENEDTIKNAKGNLSCHKISGGVIVEVNPNYIINAITRVDNGLINQNDIAKMKQSMAEAEVAFRKFLIRKGKEEKHECLVVGIYCINDVTTISLDGVTYPAFRLPAGRFLTILSEYGYVVRVGNTLVAPQQAGVNLGEFFNTCKVSPTKTGIFSQIQCTYTVDQIKQLEARDKAQSKANK